MTWIERAQRQLQSDPPLTLGCDSGHVDHKRMVVPVDVPGFRECMTVFDADEYVDGGDYCPGNDVVSRTVEEYKVWEPVETLFFMEALGLFEGVVIDFGSQIGWYSMLATAAGHDVLAVEAVEEHEAMTRINASGRPGGLWQARHWLDEDTPILSAKDCPPICVVKMDTEGAEVHAMRCIRDLLDEELVSNVLMEVSPVFNDTYPMLVWGLLQRGFRAIVVNSGDRVALDNYEDVIAGTPQLDMMFVR